MKYKYFKSVARWAGNKFNEHFGDGSGHFWADKVFLPHFREGGKNHSRIYFEGSIVNVDTRDLRKCHNLATGVWKFDSMVSWSFETVDFKPATQATADILVFRFKAVKGQRRPTLRIVHKINK